MRYYKEKQTRVRVLEIFKQIFYNDSPTVFLLRQVGVIWRAIVFFALL